MHRLFLLLILCFSNFLNSVPPDPLPPTFMGNLLPIVLVNHSSLPDSDIQVLITGNEVGNPVNQVFVDFDPSGVGTLVVANPGDNATNYSKPLSAFPTTTSGRVIYLPYIDSALIFFSLYNPLNMPVNPVHSIAQPNFTNPLDPNYNTIYDIFEFVYLPTATQISADATAVSFFSLPLYGYISTPDSNANTGLYQPRNYIMNQAAALFGSVPASAQWSNLFLTNGPSTLRLLSPGKAMTAASPLFDINYLDNSGAYGFSFIDDVWTSLTSFYRTNPLVIQIPNGEIYTGTINVDNTISFVSSPNAYSVVFSAPTTIAAPYTTTEIIFAGLPLYITDTSPSGDGVQVSKLFEEAIIAGLVPTTTTLSNPFLTANQPNFYTINSNLPPAGQTSGPWYDVYSKALHSLGFIYTFAFDEPLWPEVQISSSAFTPNQTYMGITIGPLSEANTTTTLVSSANPAVPGQTVTFTATVQGTPNFTTPTGTVTFSVDGVPGLPIALVNGEASFSTSTLTLGSHTIEASYGGSFEYLASVSAPLIQVISTIVPPGTTTTLTSSENPAIPGQTVTFTATVAGIGATAIPTGTVIFFIDGVPTQPIGLVNGEAVFSISTLTIGAHTISAKYSGSLNYLPSQSKTLIQLIAIILPPKNPELFHLPFLRNCSCSSTNLITWNPPLFGPIPVAYRIYADANLTQLVATVSSNGSTSRTIKFKYFDKGTGKDLPCTYYLVSVGAAGQISPPRATVSSQKLPFASVCEKKKIVLSLINDFKNKLTKPCR